MRILHAAAFHGKTAGGFIPLLSTLGRALCARGDEIALIAPRVADATWHDAARNAGFELHLIDTAGDAARFARAWRPDIAHVHFFGWEARLTTALWRSRAGIFWHVHSTVTSRPGGRVALSPRSLLKYRVLGARVERFIAVSSAIRDELVVQGAPAARVALVVNAVDAQRFRPPSAEERERARRAIGLEGGRAILFFGRDPRIKGADVLAGALAMLERATVITVASPADVRAVLATRADVIAFDHVDDVVPLFWAADALAMPSRAEGFGLVLSEAALTGLPVAASDLPALHEVAAGRDGVFFAPAQDVPALASALRSALAFPRAVDVPPSAGDDLERWAAEIIALYEVS